MNGSELSPAALISALIEPLQLKAGTKLVLAYSGGVDSQVLAAGLAEFANQHRQFQYLLVHVHHGLSDNAEIWQQHCEAMAREYDLAIEIKRVDVKQGARVSLEASAREARYHALKQTLTRGDVLLTAHHQDDQLETILLALKRGLGPKGLAAMGKVQSFDKRCWLLRPLLDVARSEIETYAETHHISHIEDESNQDNRFDRNFLRLEVIPALKSRWPAIAQTATRSAQLCAEQQALIEQEVNARLPAMLVNTAHASIPALDLSLLAQQSALWQAQILRGFIAHIGFEMPSSAQLKQILSQLLQAKVDAKVELKIGTMVLRRFQHCLYVESELDNLVYRQTKVISLAEVAESQSQCWLLDAGVSLLAERHEEGIRLRLPKETERVSVRFGATSSLRCHPHFRDKGRELKKLWQELAVPPWLRCRVPLIYFDDRLVAAVGYWVEKSFLATKNQPGLVFHLN
ncbi:tRNA lysidine(34) synthetase TilS [Shewanella sp. Isolate11]|uniref:tRNA lysidine(34) synthetase TilS n=1 Tax=Shewanella sp. Isolate11 TaxID=2908530 RepID=UPI001EFE6F26|nr:tRNA lysidine(34) synthetase TilS [Shewanella sp. Isolate11]MCG9696160.1 tRNA lysidine(34) synthetase TilS [Shewanella sp. Isolate11]